MKLTVQTLKQLIREELQNVTETKKSYKEIDAEMKKIKAQIDSEKDEEVKRQLQDELDDLRIELGETTPGQEE